MLTLRWRDYPKVRQIVRHRHRLALLYPRLQPKPETGKPAKTTVVAKQDKVGSASSASANHGLPKGWDEIDAGHLVLARDDGRWRAWWEAIPIEKAGDLFKLRWRDQPGAMTPITRPRFDLALICPDAA